MAAVLGDRDHAVGLLGQAITNPLHSIILFRSLRDYPPFQELMQPKG